MTSANKEIEHNKIATAESGKSWFSTSHCALLACIVCVALLILVTGCPADRTPAVPDVAEPTAAQINDTLPDIAEPNNAQPDDRHVPPNEPDITQPDTKEPNKVEPNKPKPPEVTFHNKCAAILGDFVDKEGMVAYRRLNLKRSQLHTLLDEFANLDPNYYNTWAKEDKIAFWINAFNLHTLKVIIDNYPIKASRIDKIWWPPTSIRHIPPGGVVGPAKWNKYKFFVKEDEQFTLAEIVTRFFRNEFNEPRVFFALSHASLSSAPLRNEPYSGRKLYEQLDDQAKKFLAGDRGFRIDKEKQNVHVYAFLQPRWYGKEFIDKYGTDKRFKDETRPVRAVLNFISNYISEKDIEYLEDAYYDVHYIPYDWRLNDSSNDK